MLGEKKLRRENMLNDALLYLLSLTKEFLNQRTLILELIFA